MCMCMVFVLFLCLDLGFDNFDICIMKTTQNVLMAWKLDASWILTKLGMKPFVNICNLYKLRNTLFSVCEHNYMYAHQINLGGLEFNLIWIWFNWFKSLEGGPIRYVIKIGEDNFVKS